MYRFVFICGSLKNLLLFYYSCPKFSSFALLLLPAHSQYPHHCQCPWVIHTHFLDSPFHFFPELSVSCLPSVHRGESVPYFHASGSIFLISLFCSLDSSYMRDHMVFVLHQLAFFTSLNILQFHPWCHKR